MVAFDPIRRDGQFGAKIKVLASTGVFAVPLAAVIERPGLLAGVLTGPIEVTETPLRVLLLETGALTTRFALLVVRLEARGGMGAVRGRYRAGVMVLFAHRGLLGATDR
ncbi:hypothetical protein R5W23_006038 [Gemmata sp. JC673]|uniref:Uncharacterized protein n=1 Tax=Gemmata algarum TaxID=2975278 RepID=A0ABU5EUF1_9BACT|nr:hypothetical protein [Gemmata algarum]MDY3558864.1 hypothetical protein [Gemmata algarum]